MNENKELQQCNNIHTEGRYDIYKPLSQADCKKIRAAEKQNVVQNKPNTPNNDGKPQPSYKPNDKSEKNHSNKR